MHAIKFPVGVAQLPAAALPVVASFPSPLNKGLVHCFVHAPKLISLKWARVVHLLEYWF